MKEATYFLFHDDQFGDSGRVRDYIDSLPEIRRWHRCMHNRLFITSDRTATELAGRLREFSGGRGKFPILDTNTDRGGWLPRGAWDLMNEPEMAGRKSREEAPLQGQES